MDMGPKKTVLLTEFAQNLEFLKKFDDLIIEQHHRRQTKFDTIPPVKKSRSSKFHQLDPRIWRDQMARKPKYGFLHDVGLETVRRTMVKQLSIFYDKYVCDETTYMIEGELPNRLFSWDKKDFLARRGLDTVWLDVLKKQMNEECLESRKFRSDIMELRRYLRLILDVFLTSNDVADKFQKQRIFKYLHDSIEVASIGKHLYAELEKHNQIVQYLSTIYMNLAVKKQFDEKPHLHRLFLERTWMDGVVIDPITMRYHFKSYEDRVKQQEERTGNAEEKLEAEIDLYTKKMDLETHCKNYVLQYFDLEIEDYKKRILTLSILYDEEFEKLDNHIVTKKMTLDKLKEQRRFMIEQLVRFREELEVVRLEEIKRKEQLERELEEERERKSVKKSKKKKPAKKKVSPKKK